MRRQVSGSAFEGCLPFRIGQLGISEMSRDLRNVDFERVGDLAELQGPVAPEEFRVDLRYVGKSYCIHQARWTGHAATPRFDEHDVVVFQDGSLSKQSTLGCSCGRTI
jgi:hypothetical protein